MASTISKNTPGDYVKEQEINNGISGHLLYKHSAGALAYVNMYAGEGLLMGKNAREGYCKNYVDVESQLRGIGLTNLVNPKPPVRPDILPIYSLDVFQKNKVQLPEAIVVQKNQRPYPLA